MGHTSAGTVGQQPPASSRPGQPHNCPRRRSRAERDALVCQFKNLPAHVVQRLRRHPAVSRLEFEDAVQVGFVGLLNAAALWDEHRGVSFMTYAYQAIKMEVLKTALHQGVIGVPIWVFQRPGGKRYWPDVIRASRCRSIHRRDNERGLHREPRARPDRIDADDLNAVLVAMNTLEPREREVLTRCLLDGEVLRAVGKSLGLSGERVRQIRDQGLARLRRVLAVPSGVRSFPSRS